MRNEPGDSAVWADIAGRDLRMARLALNDSPPMPAEACFHAQQAAEKFLKAFLVANRIPPPRTHDLIHLLALCRLQDSALEALAGPCDELNGLATDTRYPPEGEESPTAGHAQTAIRNAEAVAAQIRASIAAR